MADFVSRPHGDDHFDALVRWLVQTQGADAAYVALLDPARQTARRVAGHRRDGVPCPAAGYPLAGTPDEAVVAHGAAAFAAGLRARFPDDDFLAHTRAESFVGAAIRGDDGVPVGLVAALFLRPAPPEPPLDCLRILASFGGQWLARQRSARQLRHALADVESQYRTLFENAPVLIDAFDHDGRCVLWNAECERRFGWSLDEINAHPEPLALFYPDPAVRREVVESVSTAPTKAFREWHPLNRDGQVLTVLWSNVTLPSGAVINIGLDITERKRLETELERLASTDGLTGLFNRREFLRLLDAELQRLQRQPGYVATGLMLDLDHFKQINDSHGHIVGDAAILHFCELMRAELRSVDLAARIGGEEFFVLLIGCDAEAAAAIADRIRARLRHNPLPHRDRPLRLTVSVGVTELSPQDGCASEVLRRADQALYLAKQHGRDRTETVSASAPPAREAVPPLG